MEINFPPKQGVGLDKLMPNINKDAVNLIK